MTFIFYQDDAIDGTVVGKIVYITCTTDDYVIINADAAYDNYYVDIVTQTCDIDLSKYGYCSLSGNIKTNYIIGGEYTTVYALDCSVSGDMSYNSPCSITILYTYYTNYQLRLYARYYNSTFKIICYRNNYKSDSRIKITECNITAKFHN